ncbi:serine/threonine-protein kinase pim-2-like [Eucyclogobius newberryi]|uniref:serine/threonine-protein kinase pim-2-like n=1 Tax=Eucyclogobius newberryi TaxID=166745 RepID=UPI003B5C7196
MVANQELASDGHQVFQDPVVPKVGSDNKPSGHKSQKRRSRDADLGSDNEPKRSRSERSTVTLAGVQQEVKRREKKKKKSVRTAMKTVIEAADQADFKLKYEQHKQLGEGGYGAVFAGVRISDQQPVAIKYIHKPTVLFVPMEFKNKVHDVPAEVLLMALAAPNHEPIGRSPSVSLLEWFNLDNGHIVLVMERPIPSIDLFDYCLQNAPLPEEKAKEVMQQVVEALVDLHSKKVFHRDIKLENLLVQTTESGPRIRIIDFGCSCVVQSQTFQSEFIGNYPKQPILY